MNTFSNSQGKLVLLKLAAGIQENKAYLSEIDGLIGDGDHGANMNKGFSIFAERIKEKDVSFVDGLDELGTILFGEIGGSMGPIYGTLFMDMASAGEDYVEIGAYELGIMLAAGRSGLFSVVDARVGDKTLIDCLSPAVEALQKAQGVSFSEALNAMKSAAEKGRDSTIDMVAKYGRSSRLGQRSKGVLDAGAVSCCIILTAIADGILEQIGE